MPLYTFVAEYDGGTYVSQVTAADSKTAPFVWAQQLEIGSIPSLGQQSKLKILEELRRLEENGAQTQLQSLHHVWCATWLVRDKLMLVHFVQTAS